MKMVIEMMMMMITMMIIMCFLHPKGPQTGLAPGGPINYDVDDEIDDYDDQNDEDDDDNDDNNDGNGVFFLQKHFCVGI